MANPKPQEYVTRNGKLVPNRAYGGALQDAPKVYGLKHYGNPAHILWLVKWQERDRKRKVHQPMRHARAVDALCKQFGISASTAKNAIAALAAYRMAVLAATLPAESAEQVEAFRRIAERAERVGDLDTALRARDKLVKMVGGYSPLKVEVTDGPAQTSESALKSYIQAIYLVLDDRDRTDLERIFGNVERAKLDGRLQLPAGEDDDPPPPTDDEDDEPADAQIVGEGSKPDEQRERTTGMDPTGDPER